MADVSRRNVLGALGAVGAASILFGTTGTAQALASNATGSPLNPWAVGSARIVIAAALLLALTTASGGLRLTGAWRTERFPALLGGIGVAAYQLGFFSGVQTAGVAAGTMIAIGSCPAFTGVLQWVLRGTRPGLLWAVSTVVAISGMTLIVAGAGDAATLTLLSVVPPLIAGLGYATYTVAGSMLLNGGAASSSAMAQMFSVGAILLLPVLVFALPGGLNTGPGMSAILYLAVVPTVIAYLLFGAGLRYLAPSTVATMTLIEPAVAAVLGVVVLGEQLGGVALTGMGVIVAALAILALGTLRRTHPTSVELRST
ncbi:MAG: EamA family transporter [Rhodococcus sp.]|nr:EamA family transporter [Rhodococcus sp. (in: high G+C Gram-positive bacteria)]